MVRLLCALFLIGTVFSSVHQLSGNGEALQLQMENILTKHQFSLPYVEQRLVEHVDRLQRLRTNVTTIQSRLDALETNQQGVVNQLSDVHQHLESLAPVISDARLSLGNVATAAKVTSFWITVISNKLTAPVSGTAKAVSEPESPLEDRHQETRAPCWESDVGLSEALTELRTAATQTAKLAQRTGAALSSGLERLDSQLQETAQELENLGQQLRENRQEPPTATSPVPTVNPLQEFLDALKGATDNRQP